MKRLTVVMCLVVAFVLCVSYGAVWAGPYPDHTIDLVIPMPAGAAGDITGRLFAEELTKILGQQVIVSNKPGGSFTLGTDQVVRSKPDGYTLSYTNSPAIVHSRVVTPDAVPYDPAKDLTPLGLHVFFPNAIAVKADSPWKTFQEFVDYAKAHPGEIRVSTAGVGSTAGFVLEVTKSLAGIDLIQVPSTGGQQVVTMLLGGHVEATVDILGKLSPHVKSGDLRILFLTKKSPEFPDVPTLTDLGYPENPPSGWFGVYGPANLPKEVTDVLVPAVKKAIETPELVEKLSKLYYITDYKTPDDLAALAKSEFDSAWAVAEKIGMHKK